MEPTKKSATVHLRRYTIETPPYGRGYMEYDEDGKWVRYEDVAEIIDAANAVALRECDLVDEANGD